MEEKKLKNRKLIDILTIILVACLIGIPLLNPKLNVYFDDGIQHISRALGTLESFRENKLFPNVIFSFANNYGYSWNLFYGPISTYGLIIVNLLFKNFVVSYKFFVFICMILSGYFMYKFIVDLTKNNNVGLLASILYMTFPYHLTDLYTRNALGEYVSFIFIPIVFLGMYRLLFTEENNYHIAIGAIGLILTHNLSTVIVAFFSLIYLVFNIEKLKEPNIKKCLIVNVLFIVLVTSFYWTPMLETKFSAQYQVYKEGAMSNPEEVQSHGLKIKQLFVTMNDGSYVFELGPHILIMLAFSIMTIRNIKTELKQHYVFFLIMGIITLFMSTKYFPWKFLPQEFSIIQFPWRMLVMSAFFLSIVCAINMQTIIKKFNYKDVIFVSVISILYILAFSSSLIHYDENIQKVENLELGKISGREYEVVAGTAKAEYLPINAYDNRFYIASREDLIYVLKGKAIIEDEEKNLSRYTAKIETLDAEYTIFELPYIYYPGYEVRLDGMIVETFETENGFLGFAMGKEDNAELEVSYTGTFVMKISMLISFVSIITLCIYCYRKK